MSSPQLDLFTDPQLLFRLGHRLLGRLFETLAGQLTTPLRLPRPSTDNDEYFNILAQILSTPRERGRRQCPKRAFQPAGEPLRRTCYAARQYVPRLSLCSGAEMKAKRKT